MLNSIENKFDHLLIIIKKIKPILEEKLGKKEEFKLIQEIEEKILQNKTSFNDQNLKEVDKGEWLIKQRKEAKENIDFITGSFPIKSRSLSKEIQEFKKEINNLSWGEKYYSILSKIQYIFPKPHAIAYTTTAWRTAYYKVHYPQEFYSVLLTYHVTVHDVWLMTLKSETIIFRLENLLLTINSAKNSEKEIISIIKVLKELNKGMGRESSKNTFLLDKKEELHKILQDFKKKIIENILKNDNLEKEKNESLARIFKHLGRNEEDKIKLKGLVNLNNGIVDWKLTVKEKELLYTLKIILEMKQKNLNFRLGVDFNRSDAESFQVREGKILIPFSAITGIGSTMAKKIVDYRKGKSEGIKDWKSDLISILNKNHLEQLEQLRHFNLIIEQLDEINN